MPRSLGSLWGLTYTQILTKVLPSMQKELQAAGLIPDLPKRPGHYVIGRQPPPYFKRPYNEPLKWDNVLTFMNGSAIEFISVDRPDLIAGGSYDYEMFDEAVYFPKDVHDTKAIPSLRGNLQYFGKNPLHGSRFYVSSQAWDPAGYWVEDQKWLKAKGGDFALDSENRLIPDPEVLFISGPSHDNRVVIGEKRLQDWEKLPEIVYDIEILAKRQEMVADAFYAEFDIRRHTYNQVSEYEYDEKNVFGVYVRREDTDRDPRLPLFLSFDFGTAFNSMLVAQYLPSDRELRFIREFFESSNMLIENILLPFCAYYENHPTKEVNLFGDPAGNKMQYLEQHNLFEKVADYLRKKGWSVFSEMTGRAYPAHRLKHQFINELLREQRETWPKIRINRHACKYLLTSMKNAPMGRKMRKVKTSERSSQAQETATHLSDAFDYQVYYHLFPICAGVQESSSKGGVRFGGR